MPMATGMVSGKRLAATIASGAALATLVVAASWFVQSRLLGVDAPLMQQIITVQVYGVLLGSLMIGFRPPSQLPLSLRFSSLADCALAIPALALVVAVSLSIQFMLAPVAGSMSSAVRHILAIASDVKRIEGASAHVWMVAIFRGALVVPLFEEMLFRGALLSWLDQKMPPALAVAASAGLFAVMHVYPVLLPYAFAFGLAAGWLRLHTGSTLPGLVMHVLNSLLFLGVGSHLLR